MRQPKFRPGQLVIHIPDKKEYYIKTANFKRYTVIKNGRTTGFEDEFLGTYDCAWFDNKKSHLETGVSEDLLSNPS